MKTKSFIRIDVSIYLAIICTMTIIISLALS